ncbi:MAG TPA: ribokinase, partial [Bacteroidetes bacterium]|nr:ribokinase [Bacteroidota bacterium]
LPMPLRALTARPLPAGRVLVVGAAVLDRIFYVPRLPVAGETAVGDRMEVHPGGKGANQAFAARRMGADVRFLTGVGDDEAADFVLAPLAEAGVDLEGVARIKGVPTAEAIVAVDRRGENQIVACAGAYHRFSAAMLREREDRFEWADWLLVQNELPRAVVDTALELARRHHCRILFNPAPFKAKMTPPPPGLDLLVPNEIEAAGLLGVEDYLATSPHERVKRWREIAAENVVVTLGRRGGEWFPAGGGVVEFAAYPVEVVDSVGAGDAFCGILAALLAEGMELEPAVRAAHAGAALSAGVRGAQEGLPTRETLLAFLEENWTGESTEP